MQSAKDSFYAALRERLAAINPERVVHVPGGSRPAVIVSENEPHSAGSAISKPLDVFELHWGAAAVPAEFSAAVHPLMKLECRISYGTAGSDVTRADCGRALGQLDRELLAICKPPRAPLRDYSQPEPVFLGSMVFWSDPELGPVEASQNELRRTARLAVFFFPEVIAA